MNEHIRKAALPVTFFGTAFLCSTYVVDRTIPMQEDFTIYAACSEDSEPSVLYGNHSAQLSCSDGSGRETAARDTRLSLPITKAAEKMVWYTVEMSVIRTGLFALGPDPEVTVTGSRVAFEHSEALLAPTVASVY